MNNVNNVETEIKLATFSVEQLESIMDMPVLKGAFIPDTLGVKELESRYYDTRNRKFAKAGIVFRVRKEPSGFVATVKSEKANSGGLSERMEYNVDLESSVPSFEGFDKVRFLVDLPVIVEKEGGVEELFCVSVKRTQADLLLSDGTIVEMAIDVGEITAGDKSTPVAEIEFEIKKGNVPALLNFVAELSQAVPLYAEHKSKYARGAELSGEKTSNAGKKEKPVFDKDGFFKDAVIKNIMEVHIGRALSALSECALRGGDIGLLLQDLLPLKHCLAFYRTVFFDTEYELQVRTFDRIIEELENKIITHEILLSWFDIKRKSAVVTDLMEKHITDKDGVYGERIKKALETGRYGSALFSLWAWLERQKGRAIQLDGKEYLTEQVQSTWQDILDLYNGEKELDYKAVYYKLAAVCENSLAIKKIAGKKVTELYCQAEKMAVAIEDAYNMQKKSEVLFALFRTGASRLIYRDAGIIYGYNMQQMKLNDKKTSKILGKVSEQLQKATKQEMPEEDGEAFDDTDS